MKGKNRKKYERLISMSVKNRRIFILLTGFRDGGSKLLRAFTGCKYTHASIGLDEDMNTFYSFVNKGFMVEKINRYLKPGIKPYSCKLYALKVTEKVYCAVKKIIQDFLLIKSDLTYCKTGVAMCLFGIPYTKNRSFFCSQFVAETLRRSKAAKPERGSCLYFPEDLTDIPGLEPEYQGNHRDFFNKYCVSLSIV